MADFNKVFDSEFVDTLESIIEECIFDIDVECIDEDGDAYNTLTIGFDIDGSWGFQTGDNSFYGSAYNYPHWAVIRVFEAVSDDMTDEEKEQALNEVIEIYRDYIMVEMESIFYENVR